MDRLARFFTQVQTCLYVIQISFGIVHPLESFIGRVSMTSVFTNSIGRLQHEHFGVGKT